MFELVVKGTAFSSQDPKNIKIYQENLFCLSKEGVIEAIVSPADHNYEALETEYRQLNRLKELAKGQFLLPGFIDLHVHAPQWAQLGTALDIPLYDWLNTYTFPLEAKFSDEAFAEKV